MSTSTTKLLSGLTNDATYKFRVAALNNIGTGSYSVPSSGIAPTSSGFNSLEELTWDSAAELLANIPSSTNGVYTINGNPTYCIMDSSVNGGGWMLAMKATTGTTFNFNADYWTTSNTLNPSETNRNDGDAKFHIMNTFAAKDIMAIWPDITTNGGGLGSNVFNCWTWLENNFYSGSRISLINFFSTAGTFNTGDASTAGNYGGYFKGLATSSPNWADGIFSTQTDINFYGFNFKNYPNSTYGNGTAKVRWGFGWNENGEGNYTNPASLTIGGSVAGSDDVSGGIGMDSGFGNYSAGDKISCCNNRTGINRSARVEIYIR